MLKRVFFIFLLISTISNATIPTKNTIERLYISTFARVKYTPIANFFGDDSFTFKVNDGTDSWNLKQHKQYSIV